MTKQISELEKLRKEVDWNRKMWHLYATDNKVLSQKFYEKRIENEKLHTAIKPLIELITISEQGDATASSDKEWSKTVISCIHELTKALQEPFCVPKKNNGDTSLYYMRYEPKEIQKGCGNVNIVSIFERSRGKKLENINTAIVQNHHGIVFNKMADGMHYILMTTIHEHV